MSPAGNLDARRPYGGLVRLRGAGDAYTATRERADAQSYGVRSGVPARRPTLLDPPPHLLDDAVTLQLLAPQAIQHLREHRGQYQTEASRALRAHVVFRSRFAEDRLHDALKRDVRQLVVLGAGLDTFAYRQPHWADDLRIFEVDHPGTQTLKRQRLQAAQIGLPDNLRFVPTDLEDEAWSGSLHLVGFRADLPTFVSCLGVTMYLTRPSVEGLLRWAAQLEVGSDVAVSYMRRGRLGLESQALAQRLVEVGEALKTAFDPSELCELLRTVGFDQVGGPPHAEVVQQYGPPHALALPLPRHPDVAYATRVNAFF
ncbi:class I SAM-dependent methyltransferase [Deinococcus sp. KSM4-11]|uniref:class I SAM-dependent methyltransferase n=1 Tax=Deinococcus sp. KSM4-11 TaxID=2568654 RepID=UPI0021045EBA|nr:class I SAM-dependent methyltransferase [Deinococcus sp. KSM4-11]